MSQPEQPSAKLGLATRGVRVAFVGAGAMAREHARAFRDIPETHLAGIHSRTRARAERLATELGIAAVCDSVPDLHQITQADLVVVTVSERAMYEVALACISLPWIVLLEKPPGLTLTEAEKLAVAAQERGRRVLVGLNRRFLSSTAAAVNGLLGVDAPRLVEVHDQQDLAVAASLGHPAEVLASWMYANSIHLVDYFHIFGRGTVTSVEPTLRWSPGAKWVAATIRFESGDTGLYSGVWGAPGPWAVAVTTPDVRWELRPLESAAFQRAGERSLHPVGPSSADQEFKPGFRVQAQEVVAAVLGHPSQAVSLDQGLATMRLIHEIYQA